MRKQLPINTKVKFNIAQDLDVGVGIIREIVKDPDDNHLLYRLDVIEGSKADIHRNSDGELWVNDFEVRPVR